MVLSQCWRTRSLSDQGQFKFIFLEELPFMLSLMIKGLKQMWEKLGPTGEHSEHRAGGCDKVTAIQILK